MISAPSGLPPTVTRVVGAFSSLPQVRAIAWAGSVTAGYGDEGSDWDFDVYVTDEIPVGARAAIADGMGATRAELNNQFWEPGDEWVTAAGDRIDVIYRAPEWIEEQLDRILVRHEAWVGYSTCFWYNVLTARNVYDRDGWFAGLQERARALYPEELRRAIVAKNHPVLRNALSSYAHQIELAFRRQDRISINHRLAALLASYFDILFAVNRQPHPGEKRLVRFAQRECKLLPPEMAEDIDALFTAAARPGWDHEQFTVDLNRLLDRLDDLLHDRGLL